MKAVLEALGKVWAKANLCQGIKKTSPASVLLKRDEALKILGLSKTDNINFEELEEKVTYLAAINDPTKGGSAYIQAKLRNALESLYENKKTSSISQDKA